jgi:hypothetical protein
MIVVGIVPWLLCSYLDAQSQAFIATLDHPNFRVPNTSPGEAWFGSLSQAYPAREVQRALKFYFEGVTSRRIMGSADAVRSPARLI